MALEDAIALTRCLGGASNVEMALGDFERVRRPVVEALQDAALSSLLMLENIGEDWHLDPLPFAYKMMTRSGRITHEKLKKRDPEFAARYEAWQQREQERRRTT